MSLREKLEAYVVEQHSYDARYHNPMVPRQEVEERLSALLAAEDAEPAGEAARLRDLFKAACRWAWDQEDVPSRAMQAGAEAYRRYPDKEVSP